MQMKSNYQAICMTKLNTTGKRFYTGKRSKVEQELKEFDLKESQSIPHTHKKQKGKSRFLVIPYSMKN